MNVGLDTRLPRAVFGSSRWQTSSHSAAVALTAEIVDVHNTERHFMRNFKNIIKLLNTNHKYYLAAHTLMLAV